jgi:hypothetical protein
MFLEMGYTLFLNILPGRTVEIIVILTFSVRSKPQRLLPFYISTTTGTNGAAYQIMFCSSIV